MTVESFGDGGLMITGDSIAVARLLTIRSGLKLQALSGIKPMQHVNIPEIARNVLRDAKRPAPRKLADLLTAYENLLRESGILK